MWVPIKWLGARSTIVDAAMRTQPRPVVVLYHNGCCWSFAFSLLAIHWLQEWK